jgi:phytoene dehydrogenase-like protein
MLLAGAAHAVGWPVAAGGSQAIAEALTTCFIMLGGKIQTGKKIASLKELPSARVTLLDVTPRQFAEIMGDQLMRSYRDKLIKHRYGPGVFKMDWALKRPIPWRNPECLKSATIHLGSTFEEIAAAESAVWHGEIPERPLVILAQQSLFDTTRAPAGRQTAWAYCHVPNGSTYDMSDRLEAQIERFAPGFKDIILESHVMNTSDMETYNQNYVGGDISGGINSPFRLLLRPWGTWKAYSTPKKGVYICSSSMPPGGGVHGMSGHHAANVVLHEIFH